MTLIHSNSCSRTNMVKWSPSAYDDFKTNFDGALFKDTNEISIGVEVRNCDGEVMAALSRKSPLLVSMVLLEMLATRSAIQFILE